jgi:cytochrome c5
MSFGMAILGETNSCPGLSRQTGRQFAGLLTQMKTGKMTNWLLLLLLAGLISGSAWPSAARAEKMAEGRRVYVEVCAACHTNGVAGAPRYGDRGDWEKRLPRGKSELMRSVFKGKGAMPPKGGNPSVSDIEAVAATEYMLAGVK